MADMADLADMAAVREYRLMTLGLTRSSWPVSHQSHLRTSAPSVGRCGRSPPLPGLTRHHWALGSCLPLLLPPLAEPLGLEKVTLTLMSLSSHGGSLTQFVSTFVSRLSTAAILDTPPIAVPPY